MNSTSEYGLQSRVFKHKLFIVDLMSIYICFVAIMFRVFIHTFSFKSEPLNRTTAAIYYYSVVKRCTGHDILNSAYQLEPIFINLLYCTNSCSCKTSFFIVFFQKGFSHFAEFKIINVLHMKKGLSFAQNAVRCEGKRLYLLIEH
jgi:hypothetical protein